MSEEKASGANDGSETTPNDEEKGRGEGIKDGIRQGIGMLGAMRDAIEETLNEARERGDLSPERAKEVMRTTLEKAQAKAGEAREALDLVKQKDFDGLVDVVDGLKVRMKAVEQSLGLGVQATDDDGSDEED